MSRAHKLDLAYSIVEYARMHVSPKFLEEVNSEGVVVENRMDPARVFTCPLSLHRKLDVVCVCQKPNQFGSFLIDWVHPSEFKHNGGWRDFRNGEVDEITFKAYNEVGGYSHQRLSRRERQGPYGSDGTCRRH